MKNVFVTMSEELLAAIDHARGEEPRSATIERWLWKIAKVRRAATKLGISIKPDRATIGRPARRDNR